MDRRIVTAGVFGAVIVSLTVGTATWSRPKLFKRASSSQPKPQVAAEPIAWQNDLKRAQKASAATGRPMLIVFGAPWCTYCKKLEAETLGSPTLAGFINASFIPVHLDFDSDPGRKVAQVLDVKSLPMSVILSSQADLLGTVEGYVKAPQYAQVLQQSLEYQRTLRNEEFAARDAR